MEESKHFVKSVLIEEFYTKEESVVYWNWRFQGGEWTKQATSLPEIPYVEVGKTKL